jgi:hypothetical protein
MCASIERQVFSSWPGLTRPSDPLRESVVEVIPLGILCQDEIDFPSARPMLQVLLTLDRSSNVLMVLGPDETPQPVFFGEAIHDTLVMFPGAPSEIAGNADVKGPIRPIRYYVDPSTLHHASIGVSGRACNRWPDGRVKPGHDIEISRS